MFSIFKPKKLKTDFISYIAHEIRTPLASQRWNAEMLLDGTIGAMTDDQKKMLTQIYNSNKRVCNLIDNLLEIVHTENGKYILKPEQVDIVAMTHEILAKDKDLIKEKELNINADFSNESIVFNFDKKSLELILRTLINNAINYNKQAGTIDIHIENKNNEVVIKVTDTGLGIKDEDKEKIGKEMFRGADTKDKVEGTGLSLLLIKKVLALTGGAISFESTLGAGSSFVVNLSIKK